MRPVPQFEEFGFGSRPSISMADLLRVDDLCVVLEGIRKDSDGVPYYVYTVGGRLDGMVIGGPQGGALVGGDAMVIHAKNRREADDIAAGGLRDTIALERVRQAEAQRSGLFDSARNGGIITAGDMVSARKH